jgi:hypothetical protein
LRIRAAWRAVDRRRRGLPADARRAFPRPEDEAGSQAWINGTMGDPASASAATTRRPSRSRLRAATLHRNGADTLRVMG